MMQISAIRPVQPFEAVLVANASRARLFERDADNGAMRETASFVHPQLRMKGQEPGRNRPGPLFKGEARTAYEPPIDLRQQESTGFARDLAQCLEVRALARRYPRLSVMASPAFLGELNRELGAETRKILRTAMALDLAAFDGAELEHRVSEALQHAGASMSVSAG